jgi:hypothetical protein
MTPATGAAVRAEQERRTWQRLPLAIPIFVRGTDRRGNEFLELTMATDIGAGGALVAIRRELRPGSRLKLEIPCVPVPDSRPKSPRTQILTAKVLRTVDVDSVRLFALQFTKPLIQP